MHKTLSCCVVLMLGAAFGTKLNYPRVLLPIFDKISINFTLEVIEQGCFKWGTSRNDLIQIKPIYDTFDGECSSKAMVTVLTREKHRNTAIVLAEETRTGDTLRCDVILDVIDTLGVLTTTRELFLEEAPETFELWAQDSQGNAFTTLEGVEFNWVITSENDYGKDSWQQVLRFLTFTESPYHEVPKSLEKFEAQGLKGYMVLLEGKNTGSAKVSVRMPYPEYNFVSPIEVSIMVLANIILDPTDVHMLADDTVDFRIMQLKQGKLYEISLNNQYYLEVEDESIAEISENSATGLRMGRTVIILRDRNVPTGGGLFDSEGNVVTSPAPRATITVTTASKITINLLPHYNWVTTEGEKHEIAIDLYTHDDQKIRLGPRYKADSSFQESLFYVLYKSKNGSRIYGEAVMEGVTPVKGSFEKLSAKAELQIYKELTLSPTRTVLPFDPNSPKKQKIKFVAKGGDESYVWSSQNAKLVYISQSGIAETRIDGSYGDVPTEYLVDESSNVVTKHTSVRVALSRNTKIFRTAEIFFLPPVKLSIRKYNFETALRDYVKIHLSVYSFVNGTYVPFTNCDNLNFDLEFSSQIFQLDSKREPVEGELATEACHIVYLKGTSLGTTHLKISYKFMDKILRDEATLVVFEKLNILNPIVNEIVLPIGASRNVIYTNGPQKLFNIEAELQNRVDYAADIIDVTKIETEASASMLVYNVLCRIVGETVLDLELFNSIPRQSFDPYISKHVTKVYCVKPRFINLYTTEILRQSCPIEMKNSLMHVKNRAENLDIEIEVLDARNRKLMNITSLVIEWLFAQGSENYHSSVLHYRQTEEEFINDVRVPGRDFLVTAIGDVTTSFKVKAMVVKYDTNLLNSFGIVPEKPNFGIEKSKGGGLVQPVIENEIKFMAVNSTLLDSDNISIFLGRNRPERVRIAQGSGFYEIKLTEQGIVAVEFDPKTRELILVPHQIGIVEMELIDRCLMTEAARLIISVVSIGSIEVIMPDRVERGKSIEAVVKLHDSNDDLMIIDNANLPIYELHENIFNAAIVGVRLGDQSGLGLGEIRYHINGLELGETKIIFNSGYGDRAISSEPANIQVFPPLRLYPRNSTLIIGSSLQIYSHGGPHPDISIVYSVENHNIVSMDSAVVLGGKIGTTTITGHCVGVNPIDGTQIIFSEDSVDVTVVPLDKIQVRTPLVRIKTGAIMPAFIWGMPDISPMILGTMDAIRVIWSTNQPDVVDIFGVFADAGIEYTDNDLISVRVKALNPGKAKIQATVVLSGGHRLSASVEIVVFKMLEIEAPKRINQDDAILIPPRSTIQLKANIDDVVYKLSSDSNGIVKVTPDGNVKSGDTLGRDLIIAKTFDQTLPIDVEVKNIQYILATLLYPSVKLRHAESKIPSGMNMILKISLHDNLGNEFSHNIEDVNGIKYDLSHKDTVDVQIGNNLTVAVNLPRETITMITISLKDSAGVKHSEDFIKVSVAESKHIFPTKTVFSVGDIICFDSPLTSVTLWSSSDDRMVSIDRNTGVARILSSRFKLGEKIAITNGDKSGSFLKYDIEVREADKIEFFKSFDIFSGNSYRGHLVLRNHQQVDKFSNLIARNISKCVNFIDKVPVKFFTCKLIFKDQLGAQVIENLKVSPQFDKALGTYACEVELIASQLDIVSIVKSNEVNIELEAQLSNGISDVVTLKIVPAIKVTPDTISVDQITQQGIVITGLDKVLQKVEVKPSDTSVLEVIPQARVHGSLQYKVKLIDELPTDEQLFVQIHSPLTLQDIQIPIIEPNAVMKCSMQPFNNTSIWLINMISNIGVIISIVVAAMSCYVWFFCSSQRKTEINDNAFAKSFKSTSSSSIKNLSGSPQLTPRGPSYPSSPYFGNQSSGSQNISSGNESPVYGDTILISPQKRINRRYL